MTTDVKAFRFLDLLGELRNKIYVYAPTQPELVTELTQSDFGHGPADRNRLQCPGLALASKQTRMEVLPVYFSINRFLLDYYDNVSWLCKPHVTFDFCAHVRKILIHLSVYWNYEASASIHHIGESRAI